MSKQTLKCGCSDPGCPCCAGECDRQATQILSRTDMSPDVYDLPMCDNCCSDALESGVFDAKEIRGFTKRGNVIAF